MSGRVIVVGSVNVDLVAAVDRLPAPGETVTGGTFARHAGGKGGNQATAAARLGARTALVGSVGDDLLATEARDALAGEGIDLRELAALDGPTGVALIVVDANGQNLIAVASGANAFVTSDAVRAALDRLRAGSSDVVVACNEIPAASVLAALEVGRRRGARTIFNPAPATGIGRAHLAAADVLVPNRLELASLVAAGPGVASSIDRDSEVVAAARTLLETGRQRGVRDAIVVTLGGGGAVIVADDRAPDWIHAPSVTAIDTVGAGDTFVGALAAGLAEGRTVEDAAHRAVVAASLSTTKPGARGGMPTAAELEPMVRGG
jgi:ribokinase